MKALRWWLMLVGSLRLASIWFGFFNIWALRLAVFSNTAIEEMKQAKHMSADRLRGPDSCLRLCKAYVGICIARPDDDLKAQKRCVIDDFCSQQTLVRPKKE